tara:strand:- start:163 stop:1041 length:879 start_codon:yes stop_codon:yes gene_type:complete
MAEGKHEPKQTGLVLIGMGPGMLASMTSEAIIAAKSADFRYYEAYTALWPKEELNRLEKEIGLIQKVMRPEIEHPKEILDLSKDNVVAVLIVGDPLQATTHVDLQLQAMEQGIDCRIIHGISITNIVTGAIGLSNYKFGRQTTITYSYSNWIATSPLEVLAMNRVMGQHTLALLDLDPTGAGIGKQQPMRPRDAVESIRLMIEKISSEIEDIEDNDNLTILKKQAIGELIATKFTDWPVVLCSDMGADNQSITYTNLANLGDLPGGNMNCLVFPASTSDVEEKALLRWIREG